MFVQHGSDFAKNQLPKLGSQMKEAFPRDGPPPRPTLSLSPASEFSGQRTRQVNEEFRKTNFQQAAQTGCSNLFYDLKRDDIFRRDVIILAVRFRLMPSLPRMALTGFSVANAGKRDVSLMKNADLSSRIIRQRTRLDNLGHHKSLGESLVSPSNRDAHLSSFAF